MSLSRRRFLAASGAAALSAQARRRPNILFIVADDLGYGELGCQGNPEIPTPHIDSIASQGVRFSQGYVTAPVCSPSRAGLFTGRYQTRFGHEFNLTGRQNLKEGLGLPRQETTLAEALRAAGYVTGLIGKWHLGASRGFRPAERGFEDFGFLHEGHFYVPPPYRGLVTRLRSDEPPYDDANPILRGEQPVEEPEYLTDAFTREAVSFVERHRNRPFLLCVCYNAVHSPMQAKVADVRRLQERIHDEQRRVFAAMLKAMEEGVGQILGRLGQLGLVENTLLFFISDNGGPTAELTSSNRPLRGGKGHLFGGGIRVPFLVQWPGTIPGGRVLDEPVSALDVTPTALAAAGATPPDKRLDGVDLLPWLTGRSPQAPHELLFWRYGANVALRHGDWKIVQQREPGRGEPTMQLFDLRQDPSETRNLAAERPELLRSLVAELRRINSQMAAPLWGSREVWS